MGTTTARQLISMAFGGTPNIWRRLRPRIVRFMQLLVVLYSASGYAGWASRFRRRTNATDHYTRRAGRTDAVNSCHEPASYCLASIAPGRRKPKPAWRASDHFAIAGVRCRRAGRELRYPAGV